MTHFDKVSAQNIALRTRDYLKLTPSSRAQTPTFTQREAVSRNSHCLLSVTKNEEAPTTSTTKKRRKSGSSTQLKLLKDKIDNIENRIIDLRTKQIVSDLSRTTRRRPRPQTVINIRSSHSPTPTKEAGTDPYQILPAKRVVPGHTQRSNKRSHSRCSSKYCLMCKNSLI